MLVTFLRISDVKILLVRIVRSQWSAEPCEFTDGTPRVDCRDLVHCQGEWSKETNYTRMGRPSTPGVRISLAVRITFCARHLSRHKGVNSCRSRQHAIWGL